MAKNIKSQIQLINSALNGAASSINLIKQLVRDLERDIKNEPSSGGTRNLPGVLGKFDGESVVSEDKKKYPVPENYASKSKIVYGDTLKVIERGKKTVFKQIERVKRQRVDGILAKKDGKWVVVTGDGSYSVLHASVDFYNGEEGDTVTILLPRDNRNVPFGAIESIAGKEPRARGGDKAAVDKVVGDVPDDKKGAEIVKEVAEVKTKVKTREKKEAKAKKKTASTEAKKASASAPKKTAVKVKKTAAKKTAVKTTKKASPAVGKSDVPAEDELR